jgi:fimbrial chaperone protein
MRWAVAILAGFTLAASAHVAAGGFSLSPISLEVPPRDSSAAVTVENTGDGPLVVQVRTLAWSQRDGKDAREETRDLIVNPPIFKLAPGETQLVRFAARQPAPRDAEVAFRAVFREVVQREAVQTQGIRVALAMDIPVYFQPAQPRAGDVRFELRKTATGTELRIDNPGGVHRRFSEPQIEIAGKAVWKQGFIVVLAGSSLVVDLPHVSAYAESALLVASEGEKKIAIEIPIAPGT